MEITLKKKMGLKGPDMVRSWVATVVNDHGQVILEGKAITSNGALREIQGQLEEALRAVEEMKHTAPSAEKTAKGYTG